MLRNLTIFRKYKNKGFDPFWFKTFSYIRFMAYRGNFLAYCNPQTIKVGEKKK